MCWEIVNNNLFKISRKWRKRYNGRLWKMQMRSDSSSFHFAGWEPLEIQHQLLDLPSQPAVPRGAPNWDFRRSNSSHSAKWPRTWYIDRKWRRVLFGLFSPRCVKFWLFLVSLHPLVSYTCTGPEQILQVCPELCYWTIIFFASHIFLAAVWQLGDIQSSVCSQTQFLPLITSISPCFHRSFCACFILTHFCTYPSQWYFRFTAGANRTSMLHTVFWCKTTCVHIQWGVRPPLMTGARILYRNIVMQVAWLSVLSESELCICAHKHTHSRCSHAHTYARTHAHTRTR